MGLRGKENHCKANVSPYIYIYMKESKEEEEARNSEKRAIAIC